MLRLSTVQPGNAVMLTWGTEVTVVRSAGQWLCQVNTAASKFRLAGSGRRMSQYSRPRSPHHMSFFGSVSATGRSASWLPARCAARSQVDADVVRSGGWPRQVPACTDRDDGERLSEADGARLPDVTNMYVSNM